MFSNNLNGRANAALADGRRGSQSNDLKADTKLLSALFADSHQTPSDASELAELLAQMERADGVATDVESKLDEILDTLDNLLTSLEPQDGGSNEGHTTTPESDAASRPVGS